MLLDGTELFLKCIWHEIFYWLVGKSFRSDGGWRLFCCGGSLGCRVVRDDGLCELDDLWRHSVHTEWCKITKYGISVQILVSRVEILQSWCVPRTTHHDRGYDVTIATYSLPDLYLLKRKNALFVFPESNVLSCVRAHIRSHPLHKQQGLIALLEGEKLW